MISFDRLRRIFLALGLGSVMGFAGCGGAPEGNIPEEKTATPEEAKKSEDLMKNSMNDFYKQGSPGVNTKSGS